MNIKPRKLTIETRKERNKVGLNKVLIVKQSSMMVNWMLEDSKSALNYTLKMPLSSVSK